MDTKKIMAILKNIVSNKREVERGDQLELSFHIEPTDANRQIFDASEMKNYTVEEVANLISQIDVENIDENDINYIKSLYRKFESDDVNNDIYANEQALIAPLFKKTNEYDHVVKEAEFSSNQIALDELKTHNNNLSSVKLISLKEYETDSKNHLEYLSITNELGEAEIISLTDPDYLERFVQEFAKDISSMSTTEFANKLKASTEATLDFVKLETYLTDDSVKNRMHSPEIKDNNVLGYEYEEVRRLVDQFMPGEDIYISIDKYGEIFYRVADGIIKGNTNNNGVREVKFIQVPSRYRSNEKTEEVTEKKTNVDNVKDSEKNVADPIERETGNMEVQVKFDQNRFRDLFDVRDAIMHGDDPDLQNELLSQMSALFDLCYVQEVSPNLIKCIQIFYNENKEEFENVRRSGTMINGNEMNLQEFNLMSKLDEAYQNSLSEVEEEVKEEIDEFGIEGRTVDERAQTQERGKVRTLGKKPPRKIAALSSVAIIIEILTIAFVILMFLSLDI